ncbi:MAG: helix-turn-helix transcriptional regulator [Burkholderiaceae bacterium]|nr:helix-turn-helix transcriptional regulator [Burkholderiaceae bacterium]
MNKLAALAALGALAHPIRLDAFRALVVAGNDGLTPGALVDMLDVAYAKLGFHLKDLSEAGLVSAEPSGRQVIYRAVYPRMNALLDYLTENCCQGAACKVAPGGKSCC